ncbi:MAG: RHS repeat-associated core domain-containing protein [bacterium]
MRVRTDEGQVLLFDIPCFLSPPSPRERPGGQIFINDKLFQIINKELSDVNNKDPTPRVHTAEAFSYDPVGNRLTDSSFNNWAYNANNQLTSYDGVSYTYDNNGNTISKTDASGITYYTYDPENRLTRIDFPGGTYAEYKYDPFGRRIEKNVNGTITKYLYDGEDILSEYNSSGTRLARYTHGPGIDEPLIMARSGQNYYYHADGLGSITELTDSSGTIVNSYVYNSFGKVVKETEGVQNPYTYSSRERDKESGLYFYRARFYNPEIGRFLSVDPIGFLGGDVNLYSYVRNNPVNHIDPKGEAVADPVSIVLLLAFVGVDALANLEYKEDECGNITISIPPPSMWTKGVPLPFNYGVQITGKKKGEYGVPTGMSITVDPIVPAFSGSGAPAPTGGGSL